jgi:serine O-acetyltransferase
MITEIPVERIIELVERQLTSLFLFTMDEEHGIIEHAIQEALADCEYCFTGNRNKYYHRGENVYFNPFHSGQYAQYLYFLSRRVYKFVGKINTLSDRIYYLNKCLNGLDLYYEVEMPRRFSLDHPVGTVMGRAQYGEDFFFSQNCTVGNNKGIYPVFGTNVKMLSGSKVLGNCSIGANVIISANTYIKDQTVPSCSIVFGCSPDLIIKNRPARYFQAL